MNLNRWVSIAKKMANHYGVEGCEDFVAYHTDPERGRKIEEGHDEQLGSLLEAGFFVQSIALWSKYGCPVFDVDDALLAGLLLTTPTDAPGFPHLPFPSFLIRLSSGFVPYPERLKEVASSDSDWLEVIQVSRLRNVPHDKGGASDVLRIVTGNEGDGPRSKSISTILRESTFTNAQDFLRGHTRLLWEGGEAMDSACDHVSDVAVRLVFNLCTWLESVGGLETRRESDRVLVRLAKKNHKPRARRWMLSSEIEIAPEIVEAARQSGRGGRGGWHVMRRHVVRGHMRRQVCGIGRQDRKTIWIAPFPRGPEGGDVLDHVYKITEKLKQGARRP
jgi:hypothetical protein